jgi:hypothetical protein
MAYRVQAHKNEALLLIEKPDYPLTISKKNLAISGKKEYNRSGKGC